MNQKTKRRKTMSKKTQFTRSKNKIGSLSWTSPIYTHGEGKYQNKILHDNIPGYPGYHISKRGKIYSRWDVNGKGILNKRYHLKQPHLNKNGRYIVGLSQPGIGTTKWLLHRLVALVYIPKLIGMGFTRKEVSEITGLGHQLISDYYIKYKNKYEK